ncbi:MAG: prephenate dehydratase [Planctomycetota bacterium]|jgi:chorismate mutase/prephenate dehydratase
MGTHPNHPTPEQIDETATGSVPLDDMRRQIDEIDKQLVDILSRRASIVVEIGKSKRSDGTPIYAPHRERQVLERAISNNPGPLSDRTIEAIYRELMSGSFSLELPLRVGYLGPGGSFSHVAAVRHFGSSVEGAEMGTIEEVFEAVASGQCHYGLVPYENSIGGGIADTLDCFLEFKVTIYAEALIDVRQTLLANCAPESIEKVYSKPEVFAQCRHWLASHLPTASLVPMSSSAAAVRHAAQEENAAAIGSELAGSIYGVNTLFDSIQDKPENITRFLVIAREKAEPSSDDKTTIMFVTADKPGALVDVLTVFREAEINLTHIDKRPSRRTNWQYTFFVDCEGHQSDPKMASAIEEAGAHCLSLSVLGSYPRAQRIL